MHAFLFIPYVFGLSLLFLSVGCLSDNPYEANYVQQDSPLVKHFVRGEPGPVKLSPVISEEGVISAMEAGYIPIGTTTTYTGRHCPWVCAIWKAEEVGADLVLIDEVHKGTGTRTSVVFLPSIQQSYTYGNVSGNVYGSYGSSAYVSGNYSGSTTSTTLSAVPVQVPVEIYEQTAMFLRKGDYSGFYGAILYIPPRLPDEPESARIDVTILAVLKGSPAAQAGLKRGQRVRKINDTLVSTRASIAPFEDNPRSIRSIKVYP